MWGRTLLAVVAVTCTVTLAQGPQRLNHIKDVLCVMLMNSIQKEDFGPITRRQSVNTSANNDLASDIQRVVDKAADKTDTIVKGNEGNVFSLDNVQIDINNTRKYNIQTVPSISKVTSYKPVKFDNGSNEKYLPHDQHLECDSLMNYSKGQPTLFSMVNFLRNCLNMSQPIDYYNKEFRFENTSIPSKNKNNSNSTPPILYETTPPQEKKEINATYLERLYDEKIKYNDDAENNREMKPNVFYGKYFNSRRNSEESLKLYKGTNSNYLNEEQTKIINIHEPLYTTSNPVDINLNIQQNKLVNAMGFSKIDNKTISDNSVYYGEYKENTHLNTEDLINVKEVPKSYKSGFGNIFYAYNESSRNILNSNSGQLKNILKSFAIIPSNTNLESKESKIDIIKKLHEVLELLENTPVAKVNAPYNRPNTDTRRFNVNHTPTITVLKLNDVNAPEPPRQDTISPTKKEVRFVPDERFVKYLPPKINSSNESKYTAKSLPNSIYSDFGINDYNNSNERHHFKNDIINADKVAYKNHIAKGYYFYPINMALEKVTNYQITESHKETARKLFTKHIPETKYKKKIKSTSAEVVSVSSIHYVNYLYPVKNINSLRELNNYQISKFIPQLPKKYIDSREADEHNYYQYEKVKVKFVASNRNLYQSYYFYPEISRTNKLDTKKNHLPTMYFTPNVAAQGNDRFKNYAITSKIQNRNSSLTETIPMMSDTSYSRNGYMRVESNDNYINKIINNKDKPLTRQTQLNKKLHVVTCTQKYANTCDTRIDTGVDNNESVIIDENKLLTTSVITDIAKSVKAVILEDIRRELNIPLSTKSTVALSSFPTMITTPTTKISETATQIASTQYETGRENIVLDKIMKFLEQNNTPRNAQRSDYDFKTNNKNMKIIDKDVELLPAETLKENRPKNNYTNRSYNFALQRHKKKTMLHEEMRTQKMYKSKDKILMAPKTLQTNELQISPLGVYVDNGISPINQNIIVASYRQGTEKENRGNNINHHNTQRIAQTIPNNPFLRNYYENVNPAQVSNIRDNLQNNYRDVNDDEHESDEHKDVRDLDKKFLANVAIGSAAPELHSTKDCCDREYASQLMYECCNDKVVSRRQKPLNEPNDESSYRNFLRSQHKVNTMLERVLASRTKIRSVESI